MEELHADVFSGGHLGRDRTLEKVKQRFTWPRVDADVANFVASCHTCQLTKRRANALKGQLQPISARFPFQLVGTDAIGPLPRTKRGNEFILTMVDYFTKWAEAKAVSSLTGEATKRFYKSVFSRHGCPKRLLSDNGTNFVCAEVKNYLEKMRIKHTTATPYNPISNGEVERFNQTIQQILKRLTISDKNSWDDMLDEAVWCYNSSRHAGTKEIRLN